ncbi:hypothetical protein ACOI1C_00080 [Bacillus sp. DJP31]|uniref:hypothetical protein n=1 Tax=Bacillus sp. DJP31 TaxID=3409789 RepID=UPI003BB7558C
MNKQEFQDLLDKMNADAMDLLVDKVNKKKAKKKLQKEVDRLQKEANEKVSPTATEANKLIAFKYSNLFEGLEKQLETKHDPKVEETLNKIKNILNFGQ